MDRLRRLLEVAYTIASSGKKKSDNEKLKGEILRDLTDGEV